MSRENIERNWKKSGKREQISSKVQQACGISKEESEKQFAEWQLRQRDQQRAQSVQ
jgi:uncharacterized protein YjbJ (UPF0337 family)